jgi:hypothetical protein
MLMEELLKKLNFKAAEQVLLLGLPDDLDALQSAFATQTTVATEWETVSELTFMLCFVTQQTQIDQIAERLKPLLNETTDPVLWFAYPKGTSKRYKCDFNRDSGWSALGEIDLEGVRQVAIDDDWSALRFRNVQFIKTMTRRTSYAQTDLGKQKTKEANSQSAKDK